jgi:hypothetical protein
MAIFYRMAYFFYRLLMSEQGRAYDGSPPSATMAI